MSGHDTSRRPPPAEVEPHSTLRVSFDEAGDVHPYAESVDPSVACDACDAVCCRLTVVVMPEDRVPRHLTERTPQGLEVMARDEDGWCVAVDPLRMCCSIYDERPSICRKFAMGSPYCRDVRDTYREQNARGIPLTMY